MLTETSFVVNGKTYTDDACIVSTDHARVAVTDDDGRISLSISVMRHKATAELTAHHIRLIVGAIPTRIARPLRKDEEATVLAALRFYQTHGGALDEDVQQFLASKGASALTADGVDDLAEMISKGDELLVMSYGG